MIDFLISNIDIGALEMCRIELRFQCKKNGALSANPKKMEKIYCELGGNKNRK
jgi:hypothetical protein